MKFKILLIALAGTMAFAASSSAATLLAFDFAGATTTALSNTATSTTTADGLSTSTISRGAGVSTNNAANGFRGTGFSSDGIALTNTDYFQFTIASATAGTSISLSTITMNLVGTASYFATPGVSMAYAYSLDGGTNFTLLPTVVKVGVGTQTYDFTSVAPLQSFESVILRYYASGQTTTGGFGFGSAATAGTVGLLVEGTIPEPASALLGALGLLGILRRRR